MPARRVDPERLLAAVNAQRAALGGPEWSGPLTPQALGAGSVSAVLAALDAGGTPEREALRYAVTHLLGLLEQRAPGRAVEVRIPPFAAIQCVHRPAAYPRHPAERGRDRPGDLDPAGDRAARLGERGRPGGGKGQRPARRPVRVPAGGSGLIWVRLP